jgi:diketogulonate reductase-like aldo/keto reductase
MTEPFVAPVLGIAWLLSRPGVTAPVLGPRTLEQLTGSFPAFDVTLDPQTVARLDELFPGPGEAPRRLHLVIPSNLSTKGEGLMSNPAAQPAPPMR